MLTHSGGAQFWNQQQTLSPAQVQYKGWIKNVAFINVTMPVSDDISLKKKVYYGGVVTEAFIASCFSQLPTHLPGTSLPCPHV